VLKGVEDAINWVIDKINGLIRGINNLGGWLGIHIDEIQKVSLQVSTNSGESYKGGDTPDTDKPPTADDYPGNFYDGIDLSGGGDTYNTENDYSTKNTTQNVIVTIQNYAAEVDTDKLLNEINRKLTEVM
jgi:hypothetical protein